MLPTMDGETLAQRRGWAGLTQTELAAKLEVGKRTIQGWESKGVPPRREADVRKMLPPPEVDGPSVPNDLVVSMGELVSDHGAGQCLRALGELLEDEGE